MTTKSRSKYLLIVPQGGFVDCLSRIGYAINACKSSVFGGVKTNIFIFYLIYKSQNLLYIKFLC